MFGGGRITIWREVLTIHVVDGYKACVTLSMVIYLHILYYCTVGCLDVIMNDTAIFLYVIYFGSIFEGSLSCMFTSIFFLVQQVWFSF